MPGTAYVMFEDLPLERMADRLPAIGPEQILETILLAEAEGNLSFGRELRDWFKGQTGIDLDKLMPVE